MEPLASDANPLCCCEYIDHNNERNHILGCCCNCQDLDNYCDKLITCRSITNKERSRVIMTCLDRLRCPWIGGAVPFSLEMILPIIFQPVLAFIISEHVTNVKLSVSLIVIIFIGASFYMTKTESKSLFLYYWLVSSLTYVVVTFQLVIVPLALIYIEEQYGLLIGALIAVCFLYLTKRHFNRNNVEEYQNGELIGNGVSNEVVCPGCRIKVHPRTYHCQVCRTCIPDYDYHCYWLNCCIGGNNRHFFIVGLFLATLALLYCSLLILTSICVPAFKFGILLPQDCSEVPGNKIELSISFIIGIYCMELSAVSFLQLLQHIWVVSKGFTVHEWRKQFNFSLLRSSPYSRGCLFNWFYLVKDFKRLRM